jgi:photosystem II stability/assembly factor-like uncharacterized protein
MKSTLFKYLIIFGSIAFVVYGFLPGIRYADDESPIKLSKMERLIHYHDLEYEMTRDPKTGQVPAGIRNAELRFVSRLPNRSIYNKLGKDNILTGQTWIPRGPDNVSGRAKCLAFDVNDNKILLAGTASGGVWRSIDRGLTWAKTSNMSGDQTAYCIEQDTRQGRTSTWYYGSGEVLSTTDRQFSKNIRTFGWGSGIYKSNDNGLSWESLASTSIAQPGSFNSVFQGVWDIEIDPGSQGEGDVYAACIGAIMKSTDGGQSWNAVLGDENNHSFSSDIHISDDGTIIAALSQMTIYGGRAEKWGVYRSTNRGADWENITPAGFPSQFFQNDIRVIKIAAAPSDNNIFYIFCETPIDPATAYKDSFTASLHSLWYCKINQNSGKAEWEERSANIPGGWSPGYTMESYGSLGGYCMAIAVHPTDPNLVFIGGQSAFRSKSGFGDTLSDSKIGGYPYYPDLPDSLHPDIHDFVFLPGNPKVMYVASDGGVHNTNDCTTQIPRWLYEAKGLKTTQFYAVAVDYMAKNDKFIFGGLQDNSSFSTNTDNLASPWRYHIGGDGMDCQVANNKKFVIGSYYNGNIISMKFVGGILEDFGLVQKPGTNIIKNSEFDFYTRFLLDPNDSKLLYLVAKNNIYRKNDMESAANDQTLRNTGWDKLSGCGLPVSTSISAIALSKKPANGLFVGTNDGRLFLIEGANVGNPNAIELTGPDFPQGGFISSIDVDSRDADKIIVSFSNYNVQSVFYSSDGGAVWTTVGGNLEENPDGSGAGPSVRAVKIVNYGGNTAYFVGTSSGLFSAVELSGSQTEWVKEGGDIIGDVIIDKIVSRDVDGLIVLATQGGGVYSAKVDLSYTPDDMSTSEGISVFPNPCSRELNIKYYSNDFSPVRINVYNMGGKLVSSHQTWATIIGMNTLKLDISGIEPGTYQLILSKNDLRITSKFVKI